MKQFFNPGAAMHLFVNFDVLAIILALQKRKENLNKRSGIKFKMYMRIKDIMENLEKYFLLCVKISCILFYSIIGYRTTTTKYVKL